MAKKKKNLAGHLGTGLAYFQATVDNLLEFGFKKMKQVAQDEENEKKENASSSADENPVWKGAKSVMRFLGDIGESFYGEYEEIKARKKEEGEKAGK